MNGDLTWQGFTKIKDEAEAALVSIYIPEFDDAVEAGKLLSNFGAVWESTSIARKNRLLKSMLQAIYVDLDTREVVGLLPKETFLAPIMAMADRTNVALVDSKKECLVGMVETGESRTPRPEEPIIRIYYKLVRRFVLGLFRHRRRILERPSRLNFGRPYRRLVGRIPDLWRLTSPPPGLAGSRRSRFRRLERIHVRQLLFAT